MYTRYGFDGSERQFIGERKPRNLRICRFCGRSYPDVKFNSKAHAISEFLGNKQIIGLDECDDCNGRFSQMEEQFFNRHAILFPLYGIKGKSGVPKIKTPSADITAKNGITLINSHKPSSETLDFDGLNSGALNIPFSMKSRAYIPQNIYKCLAKYACSVVSPNDISDFKNTIEWINDTAFYNGKLPPVIMFTREFLSHPRIAYYIRKTNNTKFPFSFCSIEFVNLGYFFLIPFANNESISIQHIQNFTFSFKQCYGNLPCVVDDLSGTNQIEKDFEIKIDNVIMGKTCFPIDNPIVDS